MDKQAILAADDRKIVKVPCSEWGDAVYLREMDGRQRDQWERFVMQYNEGKIDDLSARLLVLTLVTKTGEQVFSLDELEELKSKNGTVISRLALDAAEMCSLDPEAVESAEDELKNG
jgi:hypothetical protein